MPTENSEAEESLDPPQCTFRGGLQNAPHRVGSQVAEATVTGPVVSEVIKPLN